MHLFFYEMNCKAIVDHSEGKDLQFVESFEYFLGRGLTATVNNIEVCCYHMCCLICYLSCY